jgi:hypothetical protein
MEYGGFLLKDPIVVAFASALAGEEFDAQDESQLLMAHLVANSRIAPNGQLFITNDGPFVRTSL